MMFPNKDTHQNVSMNFTWNLLPITNRTEVANCLLFVEGHVVCRQRLRWDGIGRLAYTSQTINSQRTNRDNEGERRQGGVKETDSVRGEGQWKNRWLTKWQSPQLPILFTAHWQRGGKTIGGDEHASTHQQVIKFDSLKKWQKKTLNTL